MKENGIKKIDIQAREPTLMFFLLTVARQTLLGSLHDKANSNTPMQEESSNPFITSKITIDTSTSFKDIHRKAFFYSSGIKS